MTGPGGSAIERLIAALRLDLHVYQQVSTERTATPQACLIVFLCGVCNGFGLSPRLGEAAMLAGVASAVVGWFLWALVILLVARLLGHHRGGRSLLRTLGFANAPGVLLALGGVPFVGAVVRVVVVIWLMATTALAAQAVYDVSRRRAVVIALGGFTTYMVLGLISAVLLAF